MRTIVRSLGSWIVVITALPVSLHSQEVAHRIPLSIAPDAQAHVGSVRRPLASVQQIGSASRSLRDWGGKSLEAHDLLRGHEVTLLLDWPEEAPAPRTIWSTLGNLVGEKLGAGIALSWSSMADGSVLSTNVTLPLADLPPLWLRVMNGDLSAEWSAKSTFSAHFELDGVPHAAWFADADFNGRIGGDMDRWIVGPQPLLDQLNFANPQVEIRRLDEGWCWSDASLWFVAGDDGGAAVEVRASGSYSTLTAVHAARVQREFVADLKITRELFLKANAYGDPDRPVAAQPVTWSYARDLESALDLAAAEGKPLLLEFTSMSCGWCRFLTWATHPDREVDDLLARFARVRIIQDLDTDETGKALGIDAVPCTLVFDADGKVHDRLLGFAGPPQYAAKLKQWLEALE